MEASLDMATTDKPQDVIVSYDLNLDQVNWKPNYILSKASIAQIVVSLKNILRVNPKNKYETTLYDRLKPAVNNVLCTYNEILKCNSLKEQNVKYYNLIVPLPHNVAVYPEEHGSVQMKNARIGALIKAAKQRIEFMNDRETPAIYIADEELVREFTNMKLRMKELSLVLTEFETNFLLAIDAAHKAQQSIH